jgi:hypothetical protein
LTAASSASATTPLNSGQTSVVGSNGVRKKKSSWMNTLYPTYKSRSIEFKKLFPGLPPEERLVVGKVLFTHAFLQSVKFILSSTTIRIDWKINGETVFLSKVLLMHAIMQHIKFMLTSTTVRTDRNIHGEIVLLSKVLFTH